MAANDSSILLRCCVSLWAQNSGGDKKKGCQAVERAIFMHDKNDELRGASHFLRRPPRPPAAPVHHLGADERKNGGEALSSTTKKSCKMINDDDKSGRRLAFILGRPTVPKAK